MFDDILKEIITPPLIAPMDSEYVGLEKMFESQDSKISRNGNNKLRSFRLNRDNKSTLENSLTSPFGQTLTSSAAAFNLSSSSHKSSHRNNSKKNKCIC